jgi:hypothetical protein
MPPRWSRIPDRRDPDYRRLDDRMNFAVHVAIFAVINSGLWFFRILGESTTGTPGGLPWTPWITTGWATVLFAHAIFIFAIARYDESTTPVASGAGVGFQPKSEKKASSK